MTFEGKHIINGTVIEIHKANYYPSTIQNANPGYEGWGWSPLDEDSRRTSLKGVFDTPDKAYEAAKQELENN